MSDETTARPMAGAIMEVEGYIIKKETGEKIPFKSTLVPEAPLKAWGIIEKETK